VDLVVGQPALVHSVMQAEWRLESCQGARAVRVKMAVNRLSRAVCGPVDSSTCIVRRFVYIFVGRGALGSGGMKIDWVWVDLLG
jgi:hypothetical protein